MARNVNAKRKIELHQALHGYSDGHRQLAISTKLEPVDSKLLLIFSDISGPGAKPETDGYLTGYPLSGSGFFALSRTWLALDMPRPGCVWTHTLLIRFADLAIIESLEKLNHHFRCPANQNEIEKYIGTLWFVEDEQFTKASHTSRWEAVILRELYGSPNKRVLVERPDVFQDGLVLALWSQQWPRLRRSFSFCSHCTRDRSSNGIDFDLQIFPAIFSSVARQSSNSQGANGHVTAQGDWLLSAIRDLERPNERGLRAFLKSVGSDVESGREAFKPLCTLFVALEEEYGEPGILGRALVALESEPSLSSARTARAVVANMIVKNIEHVEDMELRFVWKNIEYVEKELLSEHGPRVVQTMWRKTPEVFDQLSSKTAIRGQLVDRTVETTELSQLLGHITDVPELEGFSLRVRPEIVEEVAFWRCATELERAVETAVLYLGRYEAIEAMILAERKDLAKLAVSHFGEKDVLSVVASTIHKNENSPDLRMWTVEATRDPTGLTELLRDAEQLQEAFLTLIAGCVSEDSVPNEKGEDPWLTALRHARASDQQKPLNIQLAVFVLRRALGGASSSPGGLVRASFEDVDTAVSRRRLPEELWQKLEPDLPHSGFWLDWSRTHRIRTAVAELFVVRDLPVADFVATTRDSEIFGELVRQMSLSRAGRNYLKNVIDVLESEGRPCIERGGGLKRSKIVKTIIEAIK